MSSTYETKKASAGKEACINIPSPWPFSRGRGQLRVVFIDHDEKTRSFDLKAI